MLEKNYNPRKFEEKWQKCWINEEKEIYSFNENSDKEVYVIDTPPPFTSGKLHMGHVLNFIWIDVCARYKRMKGFNVLCPQGWDTQGLPTELKVEQSYKIPKENRNEFRKACIEWTEKCISKMKSQMTMIGYVPDWSREYKTLDESYRKKVQYSLIEFYNKGLIYKASHPVHFCPACRTAIAKAEIERVNKKTFLNYIKFYLSAESENADTEDTENKNFIEIATTRPELIPACVAVAVNPLDERFKNFVGKEVNVPLTKRKVKIISDEAVDPGFGTGAVMICTFGDEQDVKWVYNLKLDVIKAIDETGRLTSECGSYSGMKVKDARNKIIEDLKAKNLLFRQEEIDHAVGVHERCKKEVEFIITNQWFIKVIDFKNEILEAGNKIKWVPDYMKKRFEDWVKNMDWDWVISRQRVFGTPIPFWYCENCDLIIPAEKSELPVDPAVDKKICPKCGVEAKGTKDVCDCWVDSSITPLVVSKWNEDKEYFKKTYPNTLRPQGHEIIRTWAFYTIFRCNNLIGRVPFSEILINGMVLGSDGRKMSKSLGNVLEPNEIVEKYGADSVRQWACTFVPGSDTAMLMKDIEHGKKFLTKLWNLARFIEISLKGYTFRKIENENLKPIDLWILAKLDEIITKVSDSLENFNYTVIKEIQNFVWHDVCDNYVEMVKYRIYENEKKEEAQYTLYVVLKDIMKICAPFIPHITEEIYQFFNDGSVHAKKFPSQRNIDKEYLKLDVVVDVIAEIRKFKSKNNMKQSDKLNKIKIYCETGLIKHVNSAKEEIMKLCKVNEIEIFPGDFKVEFQQ